MNIYTIQRSNLRNLVKIKLLIKFRSTRAYGDTYTHMDAVLAKRAPYKWSPEPNLTTKTGPPDQVWPDSPLSSIAANSSPPIQA